MVQAWQAGLLSHDSALNLLRQGEILPSSRTNEEELALIDVQPPVSGAGNAGEGEGVCNKANIKCQTERDDASVWQNHAVGCATESELVKPKMDQPKRNGLTPKSTANHYLRA